MDRRVWPGCSGCGAKQGVVRMPSMCEDCGAKRASYGAKGSKTKRWCSGCGAKHGAVRVTGMCEECGTTAASYGAKGSRPRRAERAAEW